MPKLRKQTKQIEPRKLRRALHRGRWSVFRVTTEGPRSERRQAWRNAWGTGTFL